MIDTVARFMIGNETEDNKQAFVPVRRPPPRNMPYTYQAQENQARRALEVFQEQQQHFSEQQKQMTVLVERNIQLETDLKDVLLLLAEARDPLLFKRIQNIFQAVAETPGFKERLRNRLQIKEKDTVFPEPLSIIQTIETLLKEDLKPEDFEKDEFAEWEWTPADPKEALRQEIADYRKTLRLLGQSNQLKLAPEAVEKLINEFVTLMFRAQSDPAARSRMLTILSYLGTGILGTCKGIYVIYCEVVSFDQVTGGMLSKTVKGTGWLLYWALRVGLRL